MKLMSSVVGGKQSRYISGSVDIAPYIIVVGPRCSFSSTSPDIFQSGKKTALSPRKTPAALLFYLLLLLLLHSFIRNLNEKRVEIWKLSFYSIYWFPPSSIIPLLVLIDITRSFGWLTSDYRHLFILYFILFIFFIVKDFFICRCNSFR